ncbi:hypothetical protein BELL_0064g00080 [Botrytis elliptica]|uniref:Uncharacterized protein n=1 Tax=Botrytis elliptica TaxID=278938 RepID=A0A4Z1JX62_9HELO|nr:hypothetical protein BELL_0064g00080 [Botrytis elliptica]
MEEELSVLGVLRHFAVKIGASYRGACSDRNFEQIVGSKRRFKTRKVKDQIYTDSTNQRQINHATWEQYWMLSTPIAGSDIEDSRNTDFKTCSDQRRHVSGTASGSTSSAFQT